MILVAESWLPVAGNTAGALSDFRKKIPASCGVFVSSRCALESGLAPDFVTAERAGWLCRMCYRLVGVIFAIKPANGV